MANKTVVNTELANGATSNLDEINPVEKQVSGGEDEPRPSSPAAGRHSGRLVSEGQAQGDVAVVTIAAWSSNAVVEVPITCAAVTHAGARISLSKQSRCEAPVGVRHVVPLQSIAPAADGARAANLDNPVLPHPVKKRSHFWNFLKRSKRSPALLQCSETGEDNESVASVQASGCFSRNGICTRNDAHHSGAKSSGSRRGCRGRQAPDSPLGLSNIRHLSLGAGSHSVRQLADSQLMTLVVPAPVVHHTLNDLGAREHSRVSDHDTLVRTVELEGGVSESSSNPIGYPHLQFSQSLSSSSSSSSSGISIPMAPAPPTPDYPPFSSTAPTVHTQVDYMHCLVPDLLDLTNRVFYWGVMDRYEAEKLLDGRPEGTFLVRDSAQEEFLFSVSFRRYGRSLHARIEQWNHKFSFDSHDVGVFAAPSVCALVEHYKDPAACMFFEPMLTLPLPRSFPFTLQHLCRAAICSCIRYDDISSLRLPPRIQEYLKYYHYKQRICVRRFETHRVVSE